MRKILFLCFVFIFSPMASANLYKMLGVLSDSSLEQMTKNYLRIKKRIQPNRNSNSRESRDRFEELEEAYAILSDSDRRAQYDQELKRMQKQRNIIKESNFYKLFGVLSNSSPKQITRAYHEIRTQVHPDHNLNNKEESEERFKELQKAFRTLADTTKRFRHDALLWRTHVIPHFDAEREQRQRDLREQASNRQGRAKAVQTGVDGEDESSAEGDVAIWNKQVFELAQKLEKEGGDEDIEEAISWYRMLAQEDHVQAAWRLAPLLEDVNIEEALYRYEQVQVWDSEGELARDSVFRQAQIYHAGVYKEEKTIFPPNPEKAAKLYEEALRLGVSPQAIARQYDKQSDYKEASEWQRRKKNIKNEEKQKRRSHTETNQITGNTELHLALLIRQLRDEYPSTHVWRVLSTLENISIEPTDLNAKNSLGQTPLILAIQTGYFHVIKFVLKNGADPSIPNQEGDNALHILIMSKDKIFEDRSIDLDMQKRILILSKMMVKKSRKSTNLLSVRNNEGQLPFHLAVLYDLPVIVEWIIKQKGMEGLEEQEYTLLLQEAIQNGRVGIVQLLKENSPFNQSTEESNRLRQLAIKSGDPNVVSLFNHSQTSPGFFPQLVNFCRAALSPKSKSAAQEAGDP